MSPGCIVWPATRRIRSPAWTCAAAAGLPVTTRPITFVLRSAATMKRHAKSTTAKTRLTAGPAKIAVSRRQVVCRQYASGASDHSSSCHMRVSPSAGRNSFR